MIAWGPLPRLTGRDFLRGGGARPSRFRIDRLRPLSQSKGAGLRAGRPERRAGGLRLPLPGGRRGRCSLDARKLTEPYPRETWEAIEPPYVRRLLQLELTNSGRRYVSA